MSISKLTPYLRTTNIYSNKKIYKDYILKDYTLRYITYKKLALKYNFYVGNYKVILG
jgi:hypothetical protein